jgi:hypothetical protein
MLVVVFSHVFFPHERILIPSYILLLCHSTPMLTKISTVKVAILVVHALHFGIILVVFNCVSEIQLQSSFYS